MASINYIKKVLSKMDNDNLINFLLDVVTCGGLDYVTDFSVSKTYVENEKVYYVDNNGQHHIYKCIVKQATRGTIVADEWIDLLQTFRKPLPSSTQITADISVVEEVVLSSQANQSSFELTTPGVEDGNFYIAIYHPTKGRLAADDFTLNGRIVTLNPGNEIALTGSKIVIDLYRQN